MKKQDRKLQPHAMSLGELILTVSSCARNSQETIAAVADLLNSGRVLLQSNGHPSRAHVVQ
jgi:hypothetical protein